ncbi:hypothetical protein pb186bvf_007111 [Paramecium bursaria]
MGHSVSSQNLQFQTEQQEYICTDDKDNLIIHESLPLKSLLRYQEKCVTQSNNSELDQLPKFSTKSEQPKGDMVVQDEIQSVGIIFKKNKNQKGHRSQQYVQVHFKDYDGKKKCQSIRNRKITIDMLDEQF